MADVAKDLGAKFVIANRYANFGACINSVNIRGFRGLSCQLDFEYPITVITGLNGAGKSTVGQLLLCAYRGLPASGDKRWYFKDFFPVSVADPKPFTDHASVEYNYQTKTPTAPQNLTVSRTEKKGWSGYKRQPEKASLYLGLRFYLPGIEVRDFTVHMAKHIQLTDRVDFENAVMWANRILGNAYDEVFFQGVKTDSRTAELGMARRFGSEYSQNNMGFGEGRVIHMIRYFESCPKKSLIVIEEPEMGLHEYAQYEFVKYLMDVSLRRGHQIVFSSHSSAIINALPLDGRKMLARGDDGVKVYNQLSSIHIKNVLTDGHDGHLIICVEDVFAKSFLEEIIEIKNPDLLRRVKIEVFGSAEAVKSAVGYIKKSGGKVIGVRDGDQREILDNGLHILPDGNAPEKSIFLSDAGKQELLDRYGFDLTRHLSAYPNTDHHYYAKEAAKFSRRDQQKIETDCIRAFLRAQSDDYAQNLVDWIAEHA